MPAAAAAGMLDMLGMVGMVDMAGALPTLGAVVGGGGAADVPASGVEADGGGARPGVPALPIARAPAIKPPLPAAARAPAALTGCEREGEVPVLAGLHALITIAAIAPKLSPPQPRLHSRICNLVGPTRPTESVRPPDSRVSARDALIWASACADVARVRPMLVSSAPSFRSRCNNTSLTSLGVRESDRRSRKALV